MKERGSRFVQTYSGWLLWLLEANMPMVGHHCSRGFKSCRKLKTSKKVWNRKALLSSHFESCYSNQGQCCKKGNRIGFGTRGTEEKATTGGSKLHWVILLTNHSSWTSETVALGKQTFTSFSSKITFITSHKESGPTMILEGQVGPRPFYSSQGWKRSKD